MILEELNQHKTILEKVIENLVPDIEKGCKLVEETISGNYKILLAGNGGSAADAQHIAAEFTGRFVKERKPLPAIALTTDTSALTAIANDYGYDQVFNRQLQALAKPGDLFIGISTSGNSKSIINCFITAKTLGLKTIGLSGRDGGKMNELCDLNIVIPSNITANIQEMHILIGHIFCKAADQLFNNEQ